MSKIEIIEIIIPTQRIGNSLEKEIETEFEKLEKFEVETEIEKEKLEEVEKEFETEFEKEEKILEGETTQIIEQKFDCFNLEKCGECDQESFNKNLCINCNHKNN